MYFNHKDCVNAILTQDFEVLLARANCRTETYSYISKFLSGEKACRDKDGFEAE